MTTQHTQSILFQVFFMPELCFLQEITLVFLQYSNSRKEVRVNKICPSTQILMIIFGDYFQTAVLLLSVTLSHHHTDVI